MASGSPCSLWVPSGVLGQKQTFDIAEQNPEDDDLYEVTVTYSCGEHEGIIVSKTKEDEITWTPPLEFASANTTGKYVYVTLTATTYLGSEEIGSRSYEVFYTIPASVAPTFTVAFSDATGYKNTYGDYLQLLSKIHVAVTASSPYGGSIKSYKITANGETFTEAEATTSEITSFGNIQVRVEVIDSRNAIAQDTFYIPVRQYTLPTVSSLTVKRCNQNGTANDQGAYIQVAYAASVTSLDNLNNARYKLQYKKASATSFNTVNLTQFNNVFNISSTYIFAADTGASYEIQLVATDAFVTTTKTTLGSTATTIMHFKADGKGIGLGKVSEVENTVDVGWDINMNSHQIKNVATPEEDADAVNKAYADGIVRQIFPVGAIYISTKATSPASIFGGTWEQILDKFLLAAGAEYKAGATGGSATHTLTIEEMPSHSHDLVTGLIEHPYIPTWGNDQKFPPWYDSTHSSDSFIKATGGGAAHNNMPPYLTVYIWKRTA